MVLILVLVGTSHDFMHEREGRGGLLLLVD